MNDLINTLNDARQEILNLRRANEILSAKVQTMELFMVVLHTKPYTETVTMAPDVAYELDRHLEKLRAEAVDARGPV